MTTPTPEARKCVVCLRRELRDDEPQTCRRCVAVTRSALDDVARLSTLLVVEVEGRGGLSGASAGGSTERPLPMGELLTLMGPGGRHATTDTQTGDPPSVVGVLGAWEDSWRLFRGAGGAPYPATVDSASSWLTAHLGVMAQKHPRFAVFASDMRSLRWRLLHALGLSDDPVRMAADCFECGAALVRDYAPRSHCAHHHDETRHTPICDQGGLRDYCRCVGCGRTYTAPQYHLALRAAIEAAL